METLGLSMGNNGENGKPMKVISLINWNRPPRLIKNNLKAVESLFQLGMLEN